MGANENLQTHKEQEDMKTLYVIQSFTPDGEPGDAFITTVLEEAQAAKQNYRKQGLRIKEKRRQVDNPLHDPVPFTQADMPMIEINALRRDLRKVQAKKRRALKRFNDANSK